MATQTNAAEQYTNMTVPEQFASRGRNMIQEFSLFQDWRTIKGNAKKRAILVVCRAANIFAHAPTSVRYIGYPCFIFYLVFVDWILGVKLHWKHYVTSGLRLFHRQALVVNDRAVIRRNCVLRHSTTIGVAGTFGDYGGVAPIIGNDVDIGSNVVILGAFTIGDSVVIGAGSVVVKNVEWGAVVEGNPAPVIRINSKVDTRQ